MTTATLDQTKTPRAEAGMGHAQQKAQVGFEVELRSGAPRQYESVDAVRTAVLSGSVPRTALIRVLGGAAGSKPVAVETWAKSVPKLRSLYAPVWSLSQRGALIGLLVVGVLKSLDTLFAIGSVNPAAAIIWLLLGAGMFSPKWKLQIMGAAIYVGFQAGANMTTLWGAWMGVGAFAVIFGISAGMFIGTIVGLVKANSTVIAPDAIAEGRRPVVLGMAVPFAVFVTAAVAYVQFFAPAVLKLMQR